LNVTEQARLVEAIAGGSDIAAVTAALKARLILNEVGVPKGIRERVELRFSGIAA
jgi:hypothetical protein